jgi:hypothetical protein
VTRIADLRKQEQEQQKKTDAEIRKHQDALEGIRIQRRREENKGLVGKCYRYKNCYSCPESEADYWWLYVKVLEIAPDGYVKAVLFQIDKEGMANVKHKLESNMDRYDLITKKKYERELGEFLKHVYELVEENP